MILRNPEFRAIFAPNGNLIKQGDLVKRPKFAKTLSLIAEKGAVAFYEVMHNIIIYLY
jgi:gamma-glutamyltranspeptidase / glutathione hydrolase / leukotriene-C4 hydrolase